MVQNTARGLLRALLPLPLRKTVWCRYRALRYLLGVPRQYYWCLTQGARWKWGWEIIGRPQLRQVFGGAIVIGDNFTARSSSRGNAIGVNQPVILTAWGHGSCLTIGNDVGMSGCSITASKSVSIGNRVMIGSGALIMDTDAHPIDPTARQNMRSAPCAPIVIEDDVFIGTRAIILKGVHIGACAVIGAGAIVTRDVPPRTIVAGNPARAIGHVEIDKTGQCPPSETRTT